MDLVARAKKIKAVAFDGDGVFFTGRVFVHPETGEAFKERSHIDGQGISLLRDAGMRVAFVSAEATGFLESIARKLNDLPSVREGRWPPLDVFTGHIGRDKLSVLGSWLGESGLAWDECAYMGDDLGDYEVLKRVGLASAPAQAEEHIKKVAHFVASREGGNGAIRDLVNLILEAKGTDITSLNLR